MILHPGKIKKKRFDKLKAPLKDEDKRLKFLGELDFDEVDLDKDDEYEADDEEYEDGDEELVTEFDFGF